jgi:hypothetical protein
MAGRCLLSEHESTHRWSGADCVRRRELLRQTIAAFDNPTRRIAITASPKAISTAGNLAVVSGSRDSALKCFPVTGVRSLVR